VPVERLAAHGGGGVADPELEVSPGRAGDREAKVLRERLAAFERARWVRLQRERDHVAGDRLDVDGRAVVVGNDDDAHWAQLFF
jgi:hypothetical protein